MRLKFKCSSCGSTEQPLVESMAGVVAIYRDVGGRKIYSVKCVGCNNTYDHDAGKADR